MVLKRLFVTALGALGLGALVAGPAVAQDQIPAPRLYGNISTCAGGMLPGASTATRQADTYKGLLDSAFDSGAAAGIQMDYTQDAARIGIGTDGAANEAERTGILALLDLSMNCTNPVASNVSTARTIYTSYTNAKKTFEALEEPTEEDAATYNTARMNKDDYGGAVYNAAYDQQARFNAATKAISDYNNLAGTYTAATATTSAMGVLAVLKDGGSGATGYDEILVNALTSGDTIRIADLDLAPTGPDPDNPGSTIALTGEAKTSNINAQAAPVYGSGNTAGYRAIRGNNDPAATAVDVNTTNGAFNSAGALQFAVGNRVAGVTTDVVARASTDINTLGEIAAELARWETAVNAADKALKDAQKAGNVHTTLEQENLRRATLGRDHVQGELDRLTRVVRSQNLAIADADQLSIGFGDNITTYGTERVLVDAYLKARGDVVKAAQDVRTAISNLDGANKALQSRLQSPDDYLNQLVTLRQYQEAQAIRARDEAGGVDALQSFKDAVTDAGKAVAAARAQRTAHQSLTSEPGSTVSTLLTALLEPEQKGGKMNPADDDGQALLTAISDVDGKVSTLEGQLTDDEGNPIDLSNLGNAEEIAMLTTDVSENSDDIMELDGRVADNESDIGQIQTDLYGTTSGQHDGLAACDATGLLNVANCADARSRHNEADIEEVNDKLMQKKEYIDNLAAEIGVDPVTGEGTGENGMSRIDMNAAAIDAEEKARMEADTALGGRIDAEAMVRADADMALGMRIDGEAMARAEADLMLGTLIMDEEAARMEADTMLGGMIAAEEMARMEADSALGGRISSNADAIASNMNSIGQNASAISDNRNMIGELSDDLDVVRAGVAASMALAGMPAINGRGISIGVGSYDGESAFAVGFQIQGEQASFKVGVTSSGGETGASAGVGFNF